MKNETHSFLHYLASSYSEHAIHLKQGFTTSWTMVLREMEKTDDASAIQKAINACSEAGGGTVLVPAGHTFLCGPFKLASYVELQLAPNSRLLANPDESIYTESAFGANRGEGMMWISGKDLEKCINHRNWKH